MNKKEPKFVDQLTHLFILAMEDEINEEEFLSLTQILKVNAVAREYYYDFIASYVGLDQLSILSEIDDDQENLFSQEVWKDLLEHEQTAPTIDIPKEKPPRELIQKVVYPPREKRKISKFNIVFLAMNAAAILFFFLFLRFTSPKSGVEVATLTGSIDAKWADVTGSMDKGTRLATRSDKLFLRKGLAELVFDNNAKIVIEGPAEFSLLGEGRIDLQYGRIYATVPREAIGFTVSTPTARVIDLGTEFGVQADAFGDVYLHVIKGKTTLLTGDKSGRVNLEVAAGRAKRVSGTTQEISDIPCDSHLFARAIDSNRKIIWRQQPTLDLADIVGGGNGLGTGQHNIMIHPVKDLTDVLSSSFSTSKEYRLLSENPYVDGVFVPDGSTEQVISSRGDVFHECPRTSGLFDNQIVVNPKPGLYMTDQREGTIQFNGQVYADGGKPCIVMHSNLGLTFDLDAIRNSYQRNITRFISHVGIADLKENIYCNADFWVLVDGKVRYSLSQYKEKGVLNDVSVEINDTDHFLTLITTDGGDPDYPKEGFYKRAISCDWCVFTEPVLVLE